ncbi:MAG: Hsp20/alpha crystallin family protein [Nitrospirales bacterium]
MELKNLLTPWNWFKKEEEESQTGRSLNVGKVTDNPLSRLHHDLDTLFDQVLGQFPMRSSGIKNGRMREGLIMPQVDIGESQKDYTITVEVPGVQEKDIDLTLIDGTLTIRGEKRDEHEDKDKHYHRLERSYGFFQRILSLPTDADEHTIKAIFKDGVLTITIAKDPQAKPSVRKITVG